MTTKKTFIARFVLLALAASSLVACKPDLTAAQRDIVDVRPSRLQVGDTLIIEGPRYKASTPLAADLPQGPSFRSRVLHSTVILDGNFTDGRGNVEHRVVQLKGLAVPCPANPDYAERVVVGINQTIKRQIGWATFEGKVGVEQQVKDQRPVTVWTGHKGAPVRLSFFPVGMRTLADLAEEYLSNRRMLSWLGIKAGPATATVRGSSAKTVRMVQATTIVVGDRYRAVSRITMPKTSGPTQVVNRMRVSATFVTAPDRAPNKPQRVRFELTSPSGQTAYVPAKAIGQATFFNDFEGQAVAGTWAFSVESNEPGSLASWSLEAEVLAPDQNGLTVAAVLDGKKGARARQLGIQAGDKLTMIGDKPVRGGRNIVLGIRKASKRAGVKITALRDGKEVSFNVPVKGRPFMIPLSLINLLVMGIFAVIVLAVSFVIAGLLTWVERRVAARMQYRVGPNRVGPQGILQWLADGIKLVLKEDVIPDNTDHPLFKLAPYLVMMGFLGTFIVLPFGQALIVADLNVGLLWVVAITGFVALGLMMAGWSANNKWSLLGGMRSSAQIISYEIPTGLALMVPVVLAGTLSTQELVANQGPWPHQWHAFDNPFTFVAFIIYFISALAEGNRTPFDLPEAESELVAGYNIEYSGWRFAVFFLCEWGNLFVIGAVATTVFLGGWQIPGVSLIEHSNAWYWQVVGLALFVAKSMTLVFVIIWIRWTLPRFRVDQMMHLCWKYFVPWSFVSILFCVVWSWLVPDGIIRWLVSWLTFIICGGGMAVLFWSRVRYSWSSNPEPGERYSWNPFY